MINTRRIVQRLVEAGMESRKAEALASVLSDAFAQSKGNRLPLATQDLVGALRRLRTNFIAWQIAVDVALFVALKATHAI